MVLKLCQLLSCVAGISPSVLPVLFSTQVCAAKTQSKGLGFLLETCVAALCWQGAVFPLLRYQQGKLELP